MSKVKMSYIFIEKQKHESKMLKEILLEMIDAIVENRNNDSFRIDNVDVSFRIKQKLSSKRCFLEFSSKERINKSIPVLQKVDRILFTSEQQRYYYAMRDYDGISASFCKRLFPKYAEFERLLRSLILLILTKAYGSNWKNETVSDEMLSILKQNAHGNVSLTDTLENMDLDTLEKYLFEQRHIDYPNVISEKLSTKCLTELSKEEICKIIEQMRPTSLWERHFAKFGSQESWMERITEIHGVRNKVAHQKTISFEEYKKTNKKLNAINKDLTKAIEGINEENFSESNVVDILRSFATTIENFAKNIAKFQSFNIVINGINEKIKEITKPIEVANMSGMVTALDSTRKVIENMNLDAIQSQMTKSIDLISTINLPISRILENDLSTTNLFIKNFDITNSVSNIMGFNKILPNKFVIPQMTPKYEKMNETMLKVSEIFNSSYVESVDLLENDDKMEDEFGREDDN